MITMKIIKSELNMIAVQDPIRREINSQHDFLSSMIERFPQLMKEWITTQEKEVEQLARQEGEGDFEVYSTIYASEISRTESCYEEEQLFNQAMLIMVFSYYESFLFRLAKESNSESYWPSAIAEKNGVILEEYFKNKSSFLRETIFPLRNQLCHNNNGTLFSRKSEDKNAIEQLIQRKCISVDDGRIRVLDRNFIHETLDDEYKILLKLADICGYKTSMIGEKGDNSKK